MNKKYLKKYENKIKQENKNTQSSGAAQRSKYSRLVQLAGNPVCSRDVVVAPTVSRTDAAWISVRDLGSGVNLLYTVMAYSEGTLIWPFTVAGNSTVVVTPCDNVTDGEG